MAPLLPHLPAREVLLADIRLMHEHAAASRWKEALTIAERLEVASAALDVKSVHLAWAIAVLYDNLGNLDLALLHILRAVSLDPLAPAVDDSLGIIVGRARKSLATEKWGEASPRLYAMMAANGLADAACHVAWANHLYANGQHEEALAVAQSVVMLSPFCGEGWQLVEAAALALGRNDVAHEAGLRYVVATRQDADDGWNSVPRSAWGRA
jgi:tetratricopeptide (TPR) repeat protein